jgi:multisubunit Na+/H+ antiporter MnhF subunit
MGPPGRGPYWAHSVVCIDMCGIIICLICCHALLALLRDIYGGIRLMMNKVTTQSVFSFSFFLKKNSGVLVKGKFTQKTMIKEASSFVSKNEGKQTEKKRRKGRSSDR